MIVEVSTESELEELQNVLVEFYKIMPYKRLIKGSEEFQEASDLWVENWFFTIENGRGKILALKKDDKFTTSDAATCYVFFQLDSREIALY